MASLQANAWQGLPATPDASRQRTSFDEGESSNSGSFGDAQVFLDPIHNTGHDRVGPASSPATSAEEPKPHDHDHDNVRSNRKDRRSGSFLLQDNTALRKIRSQRKSSRPPVSHSIAKSPYLMDPSSNPSQATNIHISSDSKYRRVSGSSRESHDQDDSKSKNPIPSEPAREKSRRDSMDADSTQIVHMALNLSESRRMASTRSISRPAAPPKLAPLPDVVGGSDLKQQLKQQRRSSRNVSPRPTQIIPTPRIPSGLRANSPLHAVFDLASDNHYRYNFSPSTLARAQRAKEQLELLSQYRRLLEVLPPLKPRFARPVTSSPPGSPLGATKTFSWNASGHIVPLGRKYNPLQYIRNRKVRARERKIIDGDRQGFNDVENVRLWIDKFYQNTGAISRVPGEEPAMPMFPGAAVAGVGAVGQALSGNNIAKGTPRARRARFDWFMEPCDMIADAYWLEQDDNRSLIEDRHWRKIFPQDADLSRPMSRQAPEDVYNGSASFQPWNSHTAHSSSEGLDQRIASDLQVHNPGGGGGGKMDRAKDKLHHMKDLYHWHSHHSGESDQLRSRSKKDSASERSDSEQDVSYGTVRTTSHRRTDTSVTHNDILQKQMLEMIAKENRDRDSGEIPTTDIGHLVPPSMVTPERNPTSKPSSRFQSRRGSMIDTSDSDRQAISEKLRTMSPPRFRFEHHGMGTTATPAHHHGPHDRDVSLPTSPEMSAVRSHTDPPPNIELSSPWSRPTSPTRNPIIKIKNILHDITQDDTLDTRMSGADHREDNSQSPESTLQDGNLLGARKTATAPVAENPKGHYRSGSLRHRNEDTVGLRGIFKGPRIDNVLRGGVSKLGDILRKKDGSSESHDVDSTDESDSERARGRPRASLTRSRSNTKGPDDSHKEPIHFLDKMPEFVHAPDSSNRQGVEPASKLTSPPVQGGSRHNRQISQGQLLSPPKSGIRSTSSSLSPQRGSVVRDSDLSESESVHSRILEGIRDANERLNSAIGMQTSNISNRKSQQWSIVDDQNRHPEQAQLTRRDIARMRTLVLSSGIKALEISRRAQESHKPFSKEYRNHDSYKNAGIPWADIADLCPDAVKQMDRQIAFLDMYPTAAKSLSRTIQLSGQRWQTSADRFTNITSPELHRRIAGVRNRVGDELSEMTRRAADDADETSKSLALDQPLKVRHVVDIIEKMLRKRRRRLRWVRRALWLTVEWILVGFMWYVWFVVMILRIFLGIGQGAVNGIKWLLWL